ncbi:MAG: S41 family peptidase [Pyrinomonadaceae bacterium]
MIKSFLLGLVYFTVVCQTVFPQFDKTVSQLPKGEPFKIERGSSFSASTSVIAKTAVNETNVSQDFSEALDVIKNNYVERKKVDYNELTKSSISAMLRTLDPHSNYFDAQEYEELLEDQRSEYFGIGATIANYKEKNSYETFIVSTFPESPAAHAGLRFGDKFITINGEKVSGKDSSYVRDKVRGKRGTIVRVTVEKFDSRKIETVEIRRNRVPSPSIPDAYLLRQNIGYIDLSEGFNYTTLDEFNAVLTELKSQGMTSLILDLRDNPGGVLEQSVRLAEKFIPRGQTIVSQRGRFAIDNRVWKSENRNPESFPLVVIVNENSASASEIVAGALQDHDRALIVGENTFGKGLVQSVINLPFDSGLTLTTARYYTPSGRSIQRDYLNESIYDYYNHKNQKPLAQIQNNASKTVTGRTIYGGNGITPDEVEKSLPLSSFELELLDPIFLFSRDVAGGRTKNFENFRITKPVKFGQRISSGNIPVPDEMFETFKDFVKRNNGEISIGLLEKEKPYIIQRLRYYLATANFGIIASKQVLTETDPQISKAIISLPLAKQLAQSAQKVRKN